MEIPDVKKSIGLFVFFAKYHTKKAFDVPLNGRVCLDAGASTGGFTDCALQNNCAHVIAVDVGSDQMAKKLREDERVSLYENTDFRTLDKDVLDAADFASIDVSFISVTKIIDVFRSLDNLKEVVLPESLKAIGKYTFSNCASLESINSYPLVEKI